MSMLENRLETEMTKMGKMIKDTVTGLTDHMNLDLMKWIERLTTC